MNSIKSLNITSAAAVAALMMCVSAQTLQARHLSPMQALENASLASRMSTKSTGAQSGGYELAYSVETENVETVYVFNRPTGGYYVVAADDAVSTAILGYTDKGSFDSEFIPDNIASLLDSYGRQVAYAAANEEVSTMAASPSDQGRPAIAPLMVTHWGQGHAYARFTPEVDGVHCKTGCVATAMSQIIYYHKQVAPKGSITYRAARLAKDLTYDFNGMSIDFDVIRRAGDDVTNSAAANEVSKLMAMCGHAVKMNYSTSGSSATISNALSGFATYLGYDLGMRNLSRSYFTDAEWDELIYSELAAGRPIFYSGTSTKEGGHAWVCDGYDGHGYYHMNWGWESSGDGYYLLSCLDCHNTGYGFNNSQSVIVGIQPAREGSVMAPVFTFNADMVILVPEISRTADASVNVRSTSSIFNQSVGAITTTFGLKLIDIYGNVSYAACAEPKTVNANMGVVSYNVPASAFPAEGTYRVSPAARDENGKWYDLQVKADKERAYYVECTPSYLDFEKASVYEATHSAIEARPSNQTAVAGIDEIATEGDILSQEIYTAAGQYVGSFAAGETPALAAGLYIVRSQMTDGTLRTAKVVF